MKYKMIAFQILVFIIMLASFLYVALNLFYNDKESYIYENLINLVNNQDLAFRQFITSNQTLLRYHSESLLLKEQSGTENTVDTQELFLTNNPDLRDISIFSTKEGLGLIRHIINQNDIEKTTDQPVIAQEIFEDRNYDTSIDFEDAFVKTEEGTPYIVFAKHYQQNNLIIFYRYPLSIGLRGTKLLNSFDSYILKSSDEVIYHSKFKEANLNQNTEYRKFFQSILKEKLESGVQTLTKSDNDVQIIGFHKAPDLGITFLSEINKGKAYSVTNLLIVQVFKVSFVLFAAVNLLGIFFSNQITSPLKELTESALGAAERDYSSRIKIKTNDEISVLTHAFNQMIDKVREYTTKLEEYNRDLEQKVQQRTQEIAQKNKFVNAMVNSLSQGLFVFDKDKVCHPTYTQACEKILNIKPAGRKIWEIIPGERSTLEKWSDTLFAEPIPFTSLVELGPKLIVNEKYISLEYFPMRDDNNSLEYVVCVATDKTEEYAAVSAYKEQKSNVEKISFMIKNKEGYLDFIKETKSNFEQLEALINQKAPVRNFLLLLHSLKGSCSLYKLSTIANAIHKVEDKAQTYLSEDVDTEEAIADFYEDIKKTKSLFLSFLDESTAYLGKEAIDGIERREYKTIDFKKFCQKLYKNNLPTVADYFAHHFIKVSLFSTISQYNTPLGELSHSLGKQINPIVFKGSDQKIDKDKLDPLISNLVHLFRNILDHGIEAAHVREERGKPAAGTITFEVIEKKNQTLVFSIEDDGTGISSERVRKKMKSLGYPESDINKSDNEVIYHIFDESFSTKDVVTDLSGRGVGMSSVLEEAKKLNGSIEVHSVLNVSTTFIFRIQT